MKKKIFLLLVVLLFITGCGKDKTIREIFKDNDYLDLGSTFLIAAAGDRVSLLYAFDAESDNNYFAYNEQDRTAVYYYNKGLMQINECIYNTDDSSHGEDCTKEEVKFLELTKEKFESNNKELGLTDKLLKLNKEELG